MFMIAGVAVDACGRFNALPTDEAERALRACCAATSWVDAMLAARPFADHASLLSRARIELDRLAWPDVLEALAAHPRIGERRSGDDRESAWSRQEQSGIDTASAEIRAALVEANRAYEERFGHVFLIFATGRSDRDMLAAARERLANDTAAEQAVVRAELARIVELRVERLLNP